jgi:hypothetical protein
VTGRNGPVPKGFLRRHAGTLILGLAALGLAQQGLTWWMNQPDRARLALPGITHVPGSECLAEATVIAALAGRGVRAHPELPDFCTAEAGLTHWYALDPVGPDGTHLAFDGAGCLRTWTPAPCPAGPP